MGSNRETAMREPHSSCTAFREVSRILTSTFLSLLLPLSFLLIARMSATLYFLLPTSHNTPQPDYSNVHFLSSTVSYLTDITTTTILTLVLSLIAFLFITSFNVLFTCGIIVKDAQIIIVRDNHQHLVHGAWVLLFLMQVCSDMRIQGSVESNSIININEYGGFVLVWRLMLGLGLHQTFLFWWKNVVKPLLDDTVYTHRKAQCGRLEKTVLAVAFGYLWCRNLWGEAELLVVVPSAKAQQMMDFRVVVESLGWCLYYLTVATGLFSVTKGFLCILNWINFRIEKYCAQNKKSVCIRFDYMNFV